MHRNYLTVFLIVVLMAFSCATSKMYDGPELPREKVAVLKGSTGGIFGNAAGIATVDGRSTGFNDMQVTVLPGKRTLDIEVIYCEGYPVQVCHEVPSVLSFEAEAGHTYIAKGKIVSGVANVWLEDAETGEVVAGYEP